MKTSCTICTTYQISISAQRATPYFYAACVTYTNVTVLLMVTCEASKSSYSTGTMFLFPWYFKPMAAFMSLTNVPLLIQPLHEDIKRNVPHQQ